MQYDDFDNLHCFCWKAFSGDCHIESRYLGLSSELVKCDEELWQTYLRLYQTCHKVVKYSDHKLLSCGSVRVIDDFDNPYWVWWKPVYSDCRCN